MTQKVATKGWWALFPTILAIAYLYPRMLQNLLGLENPWTSYLYLYGFGFIYSGSGILLSLKTGACRWDRPRDRFWLIMIVLGFCYFAALHGLWIYLSLSIPYIGGQ
jgi:hypothetical protein